MGRRFRGIYHIPTNTVRLYKTGINFLKQEAEVIDGIDNPVLDELFPDEITEARGELELILEAGNKFDKEEFLSGRLTPVFFGSALNNFGVQELLDAFVDHAPCPTSRESVQRQVNPNEENFSGFVFKIQANMDPNHRDRIAFLRICSGKYQKGIKIHNVRMGRDIAIHNALIFMAGDRDQAECAYPGDIIGLHNHGAFQVGDTFTQGELLKFPGVPNFSPELFKSVRSKDPLKAKALQKGLVQLSEEGATQVFKPLNDNRIILGAIGDLQFDVVSFRLKEEYNVDCIYDPISIYTSRWIECEDSLELEKFISKASDNLAYDGKDKLVYLAPNSVNLRLTMDRWPKISFLEVSEN
jgi:peptide chain release factor 3